MCSVGERLSVGHGVIQQADKGKQRGDSGKNYHGANDRAHDIIGAATVSH